MTASDRPTIVHYYLCECDTRWTHVIRRLLGRCPHRYDETGWPWEGGQL